MLYQTPSAWEMASQNRKSCWEQRSLSWNIQWVFVPNIHEILFFLWCGFVYVNECVVDVFQGTQEEAAEAYDIAAIKFRGLNAVTNFDMSRYDVKSIANSNLPIGGAITTGKPKTSPSDSASDSGSRRSEEQVQVLSGPSNTLIFSKPLKQDHHQSVDYWSVLGYQASTLNSVVKNPILESSFPFQTSSNLTMDFSTASAGFLCNGGGYIQQQQSNSSSSTASSSNSIPYATPVNGLNSSTSYEVSGYNSWAAATAAAAAAAAAPSLHSFQAAKPSLSVFQTPIFGMEWGSWNRVLKGKSWSW